MLFQMQRGIIPVLSADMSDSFYNFKDYSGKNYFLHINIWLNDGWLISIPKQHNKCLQELMLLWAASCSRRPSIDCIYR